jgi:hypothetical protein
MKFNDLSGQKFGNLLVLNKTNSPNKTKLTYFECICDCGNKKAIYSYYLTTGKTTTCGIKGCEYYFKKCQNRLTHGMSKSIEYSTYLKMIDRCYNPNSMDYYHYSSNGITVCDEWLDPSTGFVTFFNDMGVRPSNNYSIDRIDNTKSYSAINCRWALPTTQARNRSTNTFTDDIISNLRYEHEINKLTAREICIKHKISINKLNYIRDIIKYRCWK